MLNDITSKGNRRRIIDDRIKIEDIFINDDYLFDSGKKQETKNLCDYVLDDVDQNDILFEQEPNVVSKTEEQTPEPEQTFLEILLPKNKNRRNLAKKIKKNHQKERQKREAIKRVSKKAIEELKKAKHLQTNDDKTVNYDSDASIDDLSTIGYNSDTENMLTILVVSIAQHQVKKIIKKKYKNLKRKGAMINAKKAKKLKMTM